MSRRPRRVDVGLGAVALVLFAGEVKAIGVVQPVTVSARTRGRSDVTVAVRPRSVSASLCTAAPCGRGPDLSIPADVTLSRNDTKVLQLGSRAEVVLVRGDRGGAAWAMVIAAPKDGDAPEVLFAGDVEAKTALEITEDQGVSTLVTGRLDAEVNLCGRRALLSPKVLDAKDLSWKAARVRRIGAKDRDAAQRVTAKKRETDKAPLGRVLAAVGASSAQGAPQNLSDGSAETSWSEAKGGAGAGEFVTFRVPRAVSLTKVAFTVRPTAKAPEHGVAPRTMFVAVDGAMFEVVMPEDGWLHAGRTYEATFPAPITTSCLAVALDEAYEGKEKSPETTLAEVFAETTLDDGATDHKALVAMLDGDAAKARAAAAVLARADKPGLAALTAGLPTLSGKGRALAIDVLDEAPCDVSSPHYVASLASTSPQEVSHARRRLSACRPASVAALAESAGDPTSASRRRAISELVALAPDEAVRVLGPFAVGDSEPDRHLVRGGVEHALTSKKSSGAYLRLLLSQDTPRRTARALALLPPLSPDDGARQAIEPALGKLGDGFDESFLSAPGVALLAAAGSAPATDRLRALLGHADPRLRAVAAAHAARVPALEGAVAELAKDPEPRVREAAAKGLAFAKGDQVPAFGALASDPWAFVRRATYESMSRRALPVFDDLVGKRLAEERSPELVEILVRVVQNRGGGPGRDAVARLAASDDTPLLVRTTAVRALGELCDASQVELLTKLASKAAGQTTEEARALGVSAIIALGRLHPSDLAARLSGLRGEDTAVGVRHLVRAAIDEKDVCGKPR